MQSQGSFQSLQQKDDVKALIAKKRFAVVVSRFNSEITAGLKNGVETTFQEFEHGAYDVIEVPGAFEIPFVAQKLLQTKKYAGLIALGCVIRGETAHFDYVCQAVTDGCTQVNLQGEIPLTFGVITVENLAQAQERASANENNKGREATLSLFDTLLSLKGVGLWD